MVIPYLGLKKSLKAQSGRDRVWTLWRQWLRIFGTLAGFGTDLPNKPTVIG